MGIEPEHFMRIAVYAWDVGGQRNFGWARGALVEDKLKLNGGDSIDGCLKLMKNDIREGFSLAFGLECPLFIPVPKASSDIGRGRDKEGNRSCFASAGATVMTLGFQQLAFFLRKLRERNSELVAVLDASDWKPRPNTVFLWEAFVSGDAHTKAQDHVGDAATAVNAFVGRLRSGELKSDVSIEDSSCVLSVAGCALLWAGWSLDLRLLSAPVLVIKPDQPYQGPIDRSCN